MNIQFRNCPKSTLPTRVGWTPHWKLGFWRLPAIVLVIFTWTDLFHKKRWTFFHNVCLKPSQPSTKVSSVMIFWPRNGRNTPSHWKAHPLWVWLWMARCTSSWETFRKKGFSASHRTCWSVVVFPVACMPMRATMPFLPRPRWMAGRSKFRNSNWNSSNFFGRKRPFWMARAIRSCSVAFHATAMREPLTPLPKMRGTLLSPIHFAHEPNILWLLWGLEPPWLLEKTKMADTNVQNQHHHITSPEKQHESKSAQWRKMTQDDTGQVRTSPFSKLWASRRIENEGVSEEQEA